MNDEVKGSINDVDSFSNDEKADLTEKNFVAVTDVGKRRVGLGKQSLIWG